MTFLHPPPSAAWQHRQSRSGFEVAYFGNLPDGGHRISGCTTAVEDGQTWIVEYELRVDATWTTRSARIAGRSAAGRRSRRLDVEDAGHWRVDGTPAPHLEGCMDVDLESSALTNALPVHRLSMSVGARAAAPAAWVRALDLSVERLEQTYTRTRDDGDRQRYEYAAPAFDFAASLVFDEAGLVLDYPGIAVRAD
jgi:hypothetical protein